MKSFRHPPFVLPEILTAGVGLTSVKLLMKGSGEPSAGIGVWGETRALYKW